MIYIPPIPPEDNIKTLRYIFELIAKRRTNIFQLRSLLSHKNNTEKINGHACCRHMEHFLNAGLVEIYNYSSNVRRNGKVFKRNILYRRLFDDSVDIDKGMEEMISNDMYREQGSRLSRLR